MCSTISLGSGDHSLLAQNYDFNLDHGLVAVNLRGTVKENGRQPGEKAVRWRVKHGSITFNQYSLELPVSGMNEAGLALAMMWHDEGGDGDGRDEYARMSALQWIQYQLDTSHDVNSVVSSLETVRPKQDFIPLHYTVLDAAGNTLLVEFVNGKAKVYKNPYPPVLTNSSYETSVELARRDPGAEQLQPNASVSRFKRLFDLRIAYNDYEADVTRGFGCLESVRQGPESRELFPWDGGDLNQTITAWSIVFCPGEKTIHFKTFENKSVRWIRMNDIDFSGSSSYLTMDVNEYGSGDVTGNFVPYSIQQNRAIVERTASAMEMPSADQEGLVTIVDTLYRSRKMQMVWDSKK